ncbi:aryl-alcohol dehydrogenase-like predicted oxidoreductase [Nonomuraea polychroma]|uniref:Aryl-alcohol dehydrogenase-like predicted oxidoreductase n=1 Tax=Nonomuraea polychroma TaxID=46176 RepID=A0A438LY61_9ACTN|nr:aldo/keto reductase [Nonomuraea polychroma]RVX38456.1 aryl-alcohol dehydrogenase-like predicted oxidoreductase [Nonomuraea polychroma]
MSIELQLTGTFTIGGKTVHRLGFGAMSLTGPGVWGPPRDHDEAIRVLRRVVELGVDLIDTADSYGPYVNEELIREALHPYPEGLLIATKAGFVRTGPGEWHAVGRPAYLRQEVEMSLRRLRLERIDLLQLHRIDPQVPLEEQVGELKALQDEGKIANVGLSEVSVEELERARGIVDIVTVQNRYNLTNRFSEDVLRHCEEQGIGFIAYSPIAKGALAAPGGPVEHLAKAVGATAAQVSLAWLLAHSPVLLAIPGTSTIAHLEENLAASTVSLTPEQVGELAR